MQRKQKKKLKKEKKTENSYCFCNTCFSWVEELYPHTCYDYVSTSLHDELVKLTGNNIQYMLPKIVRVIVLTVLEAYKTRIVKKDFI